MSPPYTQVFDVPLQTTCSTGGDQIYSVNEDPPRAGLQLRPADWWMNGLRTLGLAAT